MSQNIVPINLAQAYYPLVKIDNKRTWAILHGCAENSFQRFQSTSFNDSQINITCNPPSNKNIINRVVLVKNKYHLVFNATARVGLTVLELGTMDSARCEPISTSTNTLQITVNNDQFTTNLNQYWSALSRYHNKLYNRDEFKSMTPSFLDKFQTYHDGVGSIRNPLGSLASSADGQLLRGGFSGYSNIVNVIGASTASLDLEVTEPINISPFLFSGEDNLESGLIGVNNMGLIFTNSTLDRLWSHNAIDGSQNFSVDLVNSHVLSSEVQFNYVTPNIDDPLPLQQSWPYFEVTPYPQTLPSTITPPSLLPGLAPGASIVQTTNAVQIKAIPDKIYIFASRSKSTQSVSTTDTFASITNISMTFGNRTGLLSSASQQQLYLMSVKNGLTLDFTEFSKHVGSIICIKPGEDIGLSPLSAPGMLENTQLTIQVTMNNPSDPVLDPTNTVLYDLTVVIVNSGCVSMINGSFCHQIGVFNSQDVLNSRNLPLVPYQENNSIYGGSWWDDFKKGFKKGLSSVISPVLDLAQMRQTPYDSQISSFRKLTGLGRKKAVKRKGRALVGGAMMDRDMLHDRMMEMQ